MPPIRDVMPAFELFQPASVNDALGVLNRHRADAWVMAGGMDTFDWLKDRIKKPKVVVDLGMAKELRGIKDAGGGLEIGAMTTLTTVANNPLVKERFPLLAQAALAIAVATVRARTFNIGFIYITSLSTLLVQRTYRHISHELYERGSSEVVRAEGVPDDA